MSSRCRRRHPERLAAGLLAAGLLATVLGLPVPAAAGELRVCADPNNLPFSNDRGEGFENRVIALLARDLGADVSYTWWPQRRGFVRNTLKAGLCEVIPGVPLGFAPVATTRPYLRSGYMFVARAGSGPAIASLDDPALRTARIGVQMIGNDFANTPPAHALTRRGIIGTVRGYPVYGDYAEPSPSAGIIEAVASGAIDLAIVWGPLAGWAALRQPVPLALTPVPAGEPGLPMRYDIAVGVRRGDEALRAALDAAIGRNRVEIDTLLDRYDVPRFPPEEEHG